MRPLPLRACSALNQFLSAYTFTADRAGDGGNDVAMLQEAHVGVAIRGADSAAAVAAAYADYSFSEFR